MKKWICISTVAAMLLSASAAMAAGVISTDRFGYTGVVKRYDTLADAQAGTNQVGSDVAIGNRDLSLYIVDGVASYDDDQNIIMGSWWYSTEGSAGWGNTRGNSGSGFLQLYDTDSSTDTNIEMGFGGFDGTYYTEFDLSISGENADYPNDYARFWVDFQGSGADVVEYHSYQLDLTATGLQGVVNGTLVEASNHPTGVTGTYSGLFENVSTSHTQNNGFYTFDLTLDMDNWAWANRADLDPYEFSGSYFAAPAEAVVPEPITLSAVGMAMAGLGGYIRRRRRA